MNISIHELLQSFQRTHMALEINSGDKKKRLAYMFAMHLLASDISAYFKKDDQSFDQSQFIKDCTI